MLGICLGRSERWGPTALKANMSGLNTPSTKAGTFNFFAMVLMGSCISSHASAILLPSRIGLPVSLCLPFGVCLLVGLHADV